MNRLLKKTHRPIALSIVEGCARSISVNVQEYASSIFARVASAIFLSSLFSKR